VCLVESLHRHRPQTFVGQNISLNCGAKKELKFAASVSHQEYGDILNSTLRRIILRVVTDFEIFSGLECPSQSQSVHEINLLLGDSRKAL